MPVFQSEIKDINTAVTELAANKKTVTSTAAGAVTLTAAQVIDGWYQQTGTPGAVNKTLPTAALIVAAIRGCQVGTSFDFIVQNGGDGTLTFLTAAGLTLVGTATVAAAKNRTLHFVVTNVSTPAVTVLFGPALV